LQDSISPRLAKPDAAAPATAQGAPVASTGRGTESELKQKGAPDHAADPFGARASSPINLGSASERAPPEDASVVGRKPGPFGWDTETKPSQRGKSELDGTDLGWDDPFPPDSGWEKFGWEKSGWETASVCTQPEDSPLGWDPLTARSGWTPRSSSSSSRAADLGFRKESVLLTGQPAEGKTAQEDCTGFNRCVGTGSGSGEDSNPLKHPEEYPKPGFKARSSATYGRKDLLPHERNAFAFLQRAFVGDQKEGGAATSCRSSGFQKTLLVSATFLLDVALSTLMPGLELITKHVLKG
jgi:hypothetical protein